jgi:cobalt/nickel transport protein
MSLRIARRKKMWNSKRNSFIMVILMALCCWGTPALAHFGVIIPSDDIISQQDSKNIRLAVKFIHPMEGHYMEMVKPKQFGVMIRSKKTDLLGSLKAKKMHGFTTWEASYKIKRPGDYTFYVEPTPYWEPAEDCFIVHYTKVCVDALGLEEGWDTPVGLETEIIPLTRPYGFWTGNVFTGQVLLQGKPVPYAEVEVEYLNESPENPKKVEAPADPYVTQVVKADANGVFTYAMPRAGWWGFAALSEASWKLKHNGKDKSVEIGAVYWVRTRDMR